MFFFNKYNIVFTSIFPTIIFENKKIEKMKCCSIKPRIKLQITTKNISKIQSNALSTPISIRHKKPKVHHSRFAESIDYFTKLYEKSTNNSNNVTNTNLSRSNKELSFLSPQEHHAHSLNKFKCKKMTHSPVSLSKKVLYFINSMTSLQNAISKKDPNVSKLKIDFEREKINLIKAAKTSLDKKRKINKSENNLLSYTQTEKKYIGTNINININKDRGKDYKQMIDKMTKQIQNYNNNCQKTKKVNNLVEKQDEETQVNIANEKQDNYAKEYYESFKNIYLFIKEKEKQYNVDFNYDKSEYESVNYSLCYDGKDDDHKLFHICMDIKNEIINVINALTNNFDKIKTNLYEKIKLLTDNNKKDKKELFDYKSAINQYLNATTNINGSLYNSSDLIKIFKKNYDNSLKEIQLKKKEKDEFQKEIKSYKSMQDAYNQALKDAQEKILMLEKKNTINSSYPDTKFLLMEIEKLKLELSETKEKLNNTHCPINNKDNTYFEPIINALQQLIFEINLTQKVKDYLYVIFKFIGLSDLQITNIYLSKDKKKKYMIALFK